MLKWNTAHKFRADDYKYARRILSLWNNFLSPHKSREREKPMWILSNHGRNYFSAKRGNTSASYLINYGTNWMFVRILAAVRFRACSNAIICNDVVDSRLILDSISDDNRFFPLWNSAARTLYFDKWSYRIVLFRKIYSSENGHFDLWR